MLSLHLKVSKLLNRFFLSKVLPTIVI